MRHLVTGGAGFIGSHIVAKLLEEGHEVVILDDLSNGSNLHPKAQHIKASITDEKALLEATKGCHTVFHLAAEISVPKSLENPQATLEVNAQGTLKLLQAMQTNQVQNIVYSSTSAVYGDTGQTKNHEDQVPMPLSPYAYGKVMGEYYIKTFHSLYGIKGSILRYFNVYGPGQDPNSPYAAVIPIFKRKVQNQEPITIFGDGLQSRDFIHVSDVVQANLLAMQKPQDAAVINIASGRSVTLNELAALLSQPNTQIEHLAERPGDIKFSEAKTQKAKELLKFQAQISLEEGLKTL